MTAGMQTATAMPHPASRGAMSAAVPGSVTGRMNSSSADRPAEAMVALSAPANRITKPTTVIEATASQLTCEASVPSVISSAPVSASIR